MGGLVFVASNFLAIVLSKQIADRCFAGREAWVRQLGIAAAYSAVTCLGLLALGSLLPLTSTTVLLALAVAVVLLRVSSRQRSSRAALAAGLPEPGTSLPPASDRDGLSIALGAAMLGLYAAHCLLGGTELAWDDFSYHAPAAAQWLIDQRISLSPAGYHAYYPLQAELLSLWFMLPYHADAMVGLAGGFWTLLAVLAGWALLRAQGARDVSSAGLLAGLMLLSPVVLHAVRTFSGTDVAGPALALAALAFVASAAHRPPPARCNAEWAFAGLCGGMAAGCKATFIPVVAILFLGIWIIPHGPGLQLRSRLRHAGLLLAAAALAGGFWYVRNWVLTGNPLFPAQVGPWAGPLTRAMQERTRLAHWLLAPATAAHSPLRLLLDHTRWPTSLFALSVAGYACAAGLGMRGSRVPANAVRSVRRVLLVAGLTLLAVYPWAPFSGTVNAPLAEPSVYLRYTIAPFWFGLILFAPLTDRVSPRAWLMWPVGVLAFAAAWSDPLAGDVTAALLAGALAVVGWRIGGRGVLPPSPRLAAALVCGVLAILAAIAPWKQAQTDATISAYGQPQRPIGKGWAAVAALPPGARLAWFGTSAYQYYPLFGRRLQLVPCAVMADGTLPGPYHAAWKPDAWWADQEAENLASLLPNLRHSRVEYVFLTRWHLDAWPPQYAVLKPAPRVRTLYDDGYSAILALDKP